jgi:hypothetical protein
MEWLTNAGAIAGALATIIGLIITVNKILKAAAKRSQEAEKRHKEVMAEIANLAKRLDADIGDLQYERLSQAHDFYMDRGWCPTSKKQQLCVMYKSYRAKGRNHLSEHYEAEILALPDKPIDE